MAPASNVTVLRRAFVDVCRGYSVGSYQGHPLYVRHLGHVDHLDFDDVQLGFHNEALSKGALTEVDRLESLIAKGAWSQAKEDEIARQKDTIIRFEDGKKHLVLPSIVRAQEESIKVERGKLNMMLNDRANKLGMTAEVYAGQRLNDHYIIHNLFKDRELTQPFFTESSFEDFNDSEVEDIMKAYDEAVSPCGDLNLRRLSVAEFFIGYYSACNDNLSTFFGCPVVRMTYHMVRLGSYARYYKSLMENSDMSRLPREKRIDPDAIEQAFQTQKAGSALQAEGKVPVGMTASDMKELGLQGQMSKLPKGNASFEQLIKHAKANSR